MCQVLFVSNHQSVEVDYLEHRDNSAEDKLLYPKNTFDLAFHFLLDKEAQLLLLLGMKASFQLDNFHYQDKMEGNEQGYCLDKLEQPLDKAEAERILMNN
jgi:hypothetical protein